mmetsp:Transcript_50195/g.113912  ORF Transcript_50195/g.113912 Transcript_50195/m.113912 type:complete len:439 (-) Transcript_50195:49-1365(-)
MVAPRGQCRCGVDQCVSSWLNTAVLRMGSRQGADEFYDQPPIGQFRAYQLRLGTLLTQVEVRLDHMLVRKPILEHNSAIRSPSNYHIGTAHGVATVSETQGHKSRISNAEIVLHSESDVAPLLLVTENVAARPNFASWHVRLPWGDNRITNSIHYARPRNTNRKDSGLRFLDSHRRPTIQTMLVAKLIRSQRRRPFRNRKHKRSRRRLQKRKLPQCHHLAVLVLHKDRLDVVGDLLRTVHWMNQTLLHTGKSALTNHHSRSRPIHEQKRSVLVVHLQGPVDRLRRPEQLTLTTNVLRDQSRTSSRPILNHQTSRSIPTRNALSYRTTFCYHRNSHWNALMPSVQIAVQIRRHHSPVRGTLERHHRRRSITGAQTLHPQHLAVLIHRVHHLNVMNTLGSAIHHRMYCTHTPVRRSSLPHNDRHQIFANRHVRSMLRARK